MTRLATITPDARRRSGLAIVLDHLADSHPEDHQAALDRLEDLDVSATALARRLNVIATEDNLRGVRVNEKSIRDWRERR